MKRIKHISIAAAAILGATASVALAQVSDDSTGDATILAPLTIENIQALSFGTIAPNVLSTGTAGWIPGNAFSCSAAITCFGSDQTTGRFRVNGQANLAVVFTIPNSITLSDGANSMLINNVSSGVLEGGPGGPFYGTSTLTLNNSGTNQFTVGGIVNVGANQAPGTYSSTFTVTAEYQ